ncbi:MAG: RsmE family RNA methyltransferase [Butyricimonas faecihominis]
MHLFYTPDITTNEYTLPEEESKHCVKVLRLEWGDEIFILTGKAVFYRCEIIQAQPKRCEVRRVEKTEEYGKQAFHIHIAIAPTKNIERIEWFLEKCTEIGLTKLRPYSAITRNAR